MRNIWEETMATIIVICAILLIAFAIYSTVRKMRGKAKSSCCGTSEVKTVKKVDDTDEPHYPYEESGCQRNPQIPRQSRR